MKSRLIIAEPERCSDLYWATHFSAPDPIIYIEHQGKKIVLASDLEYGRALKEAKVDQVLSISHYARQLRAKGNPKPREMDIIERVLKERKIRRLEVPSYFPFYYVHELEKRGFTIDLAPDPFFPKRQFKTREEKGHIVKSLRATEDAILFAKEVIRKSRVKSGRLYRGGTLLTSELLRRMMEVRMLEAGYLGLHTIASCGRQAADPHCIGSGPLYANQPIVLDVFPRSIKTGYYGDITRTVIKGRPSDRLRAMYEAVKKSQQKGIETVRAGRDAKTVHETVMRTLNDHGFKTGVRNGRPEGFIHGTGHGLGLDIHEFPRVGSVSSRLESGHVVTVEPGLYYPDIGGIRIEDVVYVTATGCEILTRLPRVFELS